MTDTNAKIRVSGARYAEPVGKHFELSADGTVVKTQAGARTKRADLLNLDFETAAELFDFIKAQGADTILFAGTFEPSVDSGSVVTRTTIAEARVAFSPDQMPDLFAASKDYLAHRGAQRF